LVICPDLAGPPPVAASPCASSRHRGCLRSSYAANRSRAAAAAQVRTNASAFPLGKPFRTILRVLIILLAAIGVLYVLVVLLGKRQQPGRDGLAAGRLDRRPGPTAVNHSSTVPHYVSGMDETQTLALQALRELLDNPDRDDWDKLVAASRTLIKAIETGQSARRLADVIMIDRNATAAAEIATLRQKLTAAEARIREMDQHSMIEADKRFASWKSRIPTLDDMRERMSALLRDMNNQSSV